MLKLNNKKTAYLSKIKWALVLLFLFPQTSLSSRRGSFETSKSTSGIRSGATHASPHPQSPGKVIPTSTNSSTNYMNQMLISPGAINDLKDTLINGKDNNFEKNTKLTWPSLPRDWLEYHTTAYVTSNTYAGFKATPKLFGLEATIASKLNFDFRYHVKSTFVAIAPQSNENLKDPNNTLFEYDHKYMQTYFNTHSHNLVGICIYEVSFSYDKSLGFAMDIMGSGQGFSNGQVAGITNTHFSSFFQIEEDPNADGATKRSKLSIKEYERDCMRRFNEERRTQISADFSKQIMQFFFHNHPKSQCTPTFDDVHPEGDPSCEGWFNENINEVTRKLTVPRCVLQKGGYHSCTLTAKKEGVSCPIYQNSDGSYSDRKLLPDSRRVSSRNIHDYSFPCDEKLGLRCSVTKKPTLLGKIIFSDGQARCQRAY